MGKNYGTLINMLHFVHEIKGNSYSVVKAN
jgi:hypothetical protein